jgi:hypothetical protein
MPAAQLPQGRIPLAVFNLGNFFACKNFRSVSPTRPEGAERRLKC